MMSRDDRFLGFRANDYIATILMAFYYSLYNIVDFSFIWWLTLMLPWVYIFFIDVFWRWLIDAASLALSFRLISWCWLILRGNYQHWFRQYIWRRCSSWPIFIRYRRECCLLRYRHRVWHLMADGPIYQWQAWWFTLDTLKCTPAHYFRYWAAIAFYDADS